MQELLLNIARSLVEYPALISLIETRGHSTIVLELSAAKEDMGKIIGKNGKIIDAIRTILISIASRKGQRITLEVLEAKQYDLEEVIKESYS